MCPDHVYLKEAVEQFDRKVRVFAKLSHCSPWYDIEKLRKRFLGLSGSSLGHVHQTNRQRHKCTSELRLSDLTKVGKYQWLCNLI